MQLFRSCAPFLFILACSPAPAPESPTPTPTTDPTTAPAEPTATSSATATPSATGTATAPPAPYTGSLTQAQVLAGIDDLCAGVEKDMDAAKSKKRTDGIQLLMDVGPIGIRVHNDFWFAALAVQLGVDMDDLSAFFDDPKMLGDGTKMTAGLDKVKATFALYKTKAKALEGDLPKASKASCEAAKAKVLELAPRMPDKGAKMDKAVLDVLVPFMVADQAVKRCKTQGFE